MWTRSLIVLLFILVACGTSSSPANDSGMDAAADGSTALICTPGPGYTGNSKHVGAYCTPNGGECQKYSLSCAVDLDPRGNKFCILLPCHTHADCGENACCTGDPGNPVHACVPIACLVDDASACPAIP